MSSERLQAKKGEKGLGGRIKDYFKRRSQRKLSDTTNWGDDVGGRRHGPLGPRKRELSPDQPDFKYPTPEGEEEVKPDHWVFTIGVHQENPDYLQFAKVRAKMTLKNTIRHWFRWIPGVGKAKTSEQIKRDAARKVVESKNNVAPEDMETAIDEMVGRSKEVGHTWVKFSAYSGGDIREHYSFGFYPRTGYAHPQRAVPGVVMHPDTAHEERVDGKKLYINYNVEEKNYNKGLRRAQALAQENPDYKLGGYNCTKFAQDVANAVGVSFPSKATVFPAGPSKLFFQRIYNPNQLYESLSALRKSNPDLDITKVSRDQAEIYTAKKYLEAMGRTRQNDALLADTQKLRVYLVTNPHAIFYKADYRRNEPPGEGEWGKYFESDHEYGYEPKVYVEIHDNNPVDVQDPDSYGRRIIVVKARYIDPDGIVHLGWIRPEDIKPMPAEEEQAQVPQSSVREAMPEETTSDKTTPEEELMKNEERGGLSISGTSSIPNLPVPPPPEEAAPEARSVPLHAPPPPTHAPPPSTVQDRGPLMNMAASAKFMEGVTLKELWQEGLIARERYRQLSQRDRDRLNELLDVATDPVPLDRQLEELFMEEESKETPKTDESIKADESISEVDTQSPNRTLLPEHMRFVL